MRTEIADDAAYDGRPRRVATFQRNVKIVASGDRAIRDDDRSLIS
jgi:hypothetical protein